MAADEGYERDVVHRMNEGYRAWRALKIVMRTEDWDKGQYVSISGSNNCTNGVVRSSGIYGQKDVNGGSKWRAVLTVRRFVS